MFERIRGSYDSALYKSTYNLPLLYFKGVTEACVVQCAVCISFCRMYIYLLFLHIISLFTSVMFITYLKQLGYEMPGF